MTEKASRPSTLNTLLGLVALLLALAVVWQVSKRLQQPAPLPQATYLYPQLPCDLHQQPCRAEYNGLRLQLSLTPGPLVSLQKLAIEVRLEGIEAESVVLDLQGVEMYMGLNQTELEPDPEMVGVWRGETELAVCTSGEMTWRASVLADSQDALYSTRFEFEAR